MKHLITLSLSLILGSLTIYSAHADCNLKAKVKTLKSSSAVINGVNFSKAQLEALSSACTVAKIPMTQDELVKLETENFNKRIARLNKKKITSK